MRKLKLLLTATALLLGGGGISVHAEKVDVTTQYISNPNFEGTAAITNDYKTYHKDVTDGMVSGLIAINGWTPVDGTLDARAGGPVTYGTSVKVSGQTVPASKPYGGANETALGIASTWGANAQYLSDAVTLPAGDYTITVKYYNTTSATIKTNLFGFKETGGTTHYGSNKSFTTTGSWTTETVDFTLASETTGQFSVGLAMDGGNGGAAHLFLDNIKVEYDGLGHSAPSLGLRADLGDNISLTNFVPAASNYTLEVEGTVGTQITIAGAGITYTPTTTGTVRFAKGTGSVYVYEGIDFMGVIAAGTPAFSTNIFTDENAKGSDNILANGSFETLGDKIADGKFKFGTPWTSNRDAEAFGIRVGTSGETHRLVWRGKGDLKYFGQPVTGLKPNRTYQVTVCQVDQGNGWADFNVGIGAAAGGVELASSKFTLGRMGSSGDDQYAYKGVWYTTFTTPNSIVEANTYYFTFANTNNGSHNDALTQIDWIALAEMEAQPIEGVSSAKYTADGAFRPATPKDSYDDALATAIAARDNSDYSVVTGSERTTLIGYINADEPTTADGYNSAATNLQNATNALIDATSHYQALIDAQAAVPALVYASDAKKAFITAVATSASDADEKLAAMTTNIRAYYESHAMAESDATAIDYTSRLTNYNNPSNTSGWTVDNTTGDCKLRTMSSEPYTNSDGTTATGYFDTNSWGTAFSSTVTQNVALTAGTYLLTVKARGNGTTTYQVTAGGQSTDITTSGNTGGVFGRGWNDFSVEFTVAEAGDVTIGMNLETGASSNWLSFGNFRLVKINNTLADVTDYSNLSTAITDAEAKTLGFEDKEYAPYTNADVLTKLVEAKAINQSANNEQSVVQGITTYLNNAANWTANDGEVAIIFNGNFAEANGNNPKGWTRSNGAWGQQITGLTTGANEVNEGTTTGWYYNTEGAWEYGKDDVYKMPLAENQAYKLTFKYRSHSNGSNNNMKASVLNASNEGLAEVTFAKNGDATKFVTATAYFTTGAAGNYILSLTQSGNTHLTDVSIEKVASTAKNISEEATAVASEVQAYYETVTLTRTLSASYWNTFSVPFDAAIPDGWTVKEFDSATDNEIIFKNAESIVAGKPYLVKPTTDAENPVFNNVIVKSTEGSTDGAGDYKFAAQIYNKSLATDGTIAYLATDGKIKKLNTASGLKGLRAYFIIPDGSTEARIAFIDDETTGISRIENSELRIENSVYNLQGQRVNKAQKGLYIKNGKKVIVK